MSPSATEIFAVLETLPQIIALMERAEAAMKQHAFQSWVNNLEAAVKQLEAAQTDEERFNAAKAMAAVTRKLG